MPKLSISSRNSSKSSKKEYGKYAFVHCDWKEQISPAKISEVTEAMAEAVVVKELEVDGVNAMVISTVNLKSIREDEWLYLFHGHRMHEIDPPDLNVSRDYSVATVEEIRQYVRQNVALNKQEENSHKSDTVKAAELFLKQHHTRCVRCASAEPPMMQADGIIICTDLQRCQRNQADIHAALMEIMS